MPADDIITRGDLDGHCDRMHEPIRENFAEVRGWLTKLDTRMWALVVGIMMLFAGMIANIWIAWGTKTEVREQRPRAHYERTVPSRIGGSEQ